MQCPLCKFEDDEPEWDYRFCGCYPPCGDYCERDEELADCPNCMELFDK